MLSARGHFVGSEWEDLFPNGLWRLRSNKTRGLTLYWTPSLSIPTSCVRLNSKDFLVIFKYQIHHSREDLLARRIFLNALRKIKTNKQTKTPVLQSPWAQQPQSSAKHIVQQGWRRPVMMVMMMMVICVTYVSRLWRVCSKKKQNNKKPPKSTSSLQNLYSVWIIRQAEIQ